MGLLIGQFSWLANPLLIFAAMLLWSKKDRRVLLAIVGVMLLLIAAQMAATSSIVDNEGGIAHAIEARYVGFWLWIAAGVLAGATSLLSALSPQRPPEPVPDATGPA